MIIPFAALLPVIAEDLANGFFGYGAGRRSYELYVPALTIFGPALVFFTVHYLVLRGFYALERNRTAFYVQCVIGAVNIAAAIALVSSTGPSATAAALAGAYLIAYAVGSTVSYVVLRRTVGNLGTSVLVRFLVRILLATAVATAAAYLLSQLLHAVAVESPSPCRGGDVAGGGRRRRRGLPRAGADAEDHRGQRGARHRAGPAAAAASPERDPVSVLR